MVRRAAAITIAFLYIVTVTGFAISLHYCGNRIISIRINAPAKNCDLAVSAKMKCCHNTHLKIKVKDAHHGETSLFSSPMHSFEMPKFQVAGFFVSSQRVFADKTAERAPPDAGVYFSFVFLKNSQLRI